MSRASHRLLALGAEPAASPAAARLDRAIALERDGQSDEAVGLLREAVELARVGGENVVLAKALRRLSVLVHLRGESGAREICRESFDVAMGVGDRLLAAEAENTAASFAFEAGETQAAREAYGRALVLADGDAELEGRIEQNLGIVANVQGDLPGALEHYHRSLDRFKTVGNQAGCAIAYHNLGLVSNDQRLWQAAENYFGKSRAIAVATGDIRLQALCLLNHAHVCLAQGRYEEARVEAERSLRVFADAGVQIHRADAYRVIGAAYRETGRPELAEARLQDAIGLAAAGELVLAEAESARELALLYQNLRRNQEALRFLNRSHRLFQRLDARLDLVDVGAKMAALEETYHAVVRSWGESIESADAYTYGHCERVATYALAVASALGLDEAVQTTIQLGAYLHDLGKVRVPHEILNKAGRLTDEEMDLIKLHPVHGVEMLEGIDFPWNLEPIIRWHHEKADGSGYPDGLAGDAIPVEAQVICVVDVYDALTTTRSYRAAMTHQQAIETILASRHWWRPAILEAFLNSVGALGAPTAAQDVGAGLGVGAEG